MRRRPDEEVGIFALAVIQGVVMAVAGLFAGVLYAFGGAAVDLLVTYGWLNSESTPGLSFGTVLAFLAMLMMPVLFGLFGLIVGLFGALLRNIVVRRVKSGEAGEHYQARVQRTWAVSVGVSALAGALTGGVAAALFRGGGDVIESTFGGLFFGALIGGCLLGNMLAVFFTLPKDGRFDSPPGPWGL